MNKSLKKQMIFTIILLFVFISTIRSTAFNNIDKSPMFVSGGNILYVGGTGPGNYTKIQNAINDTIDGDTVFVYDDSSPYYERLIINKNISLVGEDKNNTVVDAQHEGSVVEIYADGCLVSGFTLKNCEDPHYDYEFCVIKIIDSNYVTIKNNILSIGEIDYNGPVSVVWLYNSSYCNIFGNYISELDSVRLSSGIGLYTRSCYNNISENIISNYHWGGVHFEGYSGCEGNVIIGNYISNCSAHGIDLDSCNNNNILNNTIENDSWGIYLDDAQYTIISGNFIKYNDRGIVLIDEGCSYNTISYNIISNNYLGIDIIGVFNNVITMNNFIDNGIGHQEEECGNAYFWLPFILKSFIGANMYNNNYWSDYKGFGVKFFSGEILLFPWFQVDWHPAKEPYNIPTGGVMEK